MIKTLKMSLINTLFKIKIKTLGHRRSLLKLHTLLKKLWPQLTKKSHSLSDKNREDLKSSKMNLLLMPIPNNPTSLKSPENHSPTLMKKLELLKYQIFYRYLTLHSLLMNRPLMTLEICLEILHNISNLENGKFLLMRLIILTMLILIEKNNK